MTIGTSRFSKTLMVLALAGLTSAAVAQQVTDKTKFNVTIQIAKTCVIATADNIDFGSVTHQSGTVDPKSIDLKVKCTSGVDFAVELDGGNNYTDGKRHMIHSSVNDAKIAYILYDKDNNAWAPGAPGVSGKGLGIDNTDKYVVKIPVRATAELVGNEPVGSYSDTVNVVVTY